MPIDGYRVLVARSWPRGLSRGRVDLWLPELTPPVELWWAYQGGRISRREFGARYRAFAETQPELLGALKRLEYRHVQMTWLCRTRTPRRGACHLVVLREILNSMPAPSAVEPSDRIGDDDAPTAA
ncbi:MAG: DUF488 family protein [Planctomycetes bacterium]|nr:DUF488 family protein [Planctomycetota bacterium]